MLIRLPDLLAALQEHLAGFLFFAFARYLAGSQEYLSGCLFSWQLRREYLTGFLGRLLSPYYAGRRCVYACMHA